MNKHEELFIKSFINKDKQERCFLLLNSKKGRIKFRNHLSHFDDLNNSSPSPCSKSQSFTDILSFLISKNAPEICYCISESSKYDQKELPLSVALKELYNSGIAFIISCIPGRLAYFESEDSSQKIVLIKD